MEMKIPVHIGIIMDGNGRWAKSKGLPRIFGHREGVRAVERTLRAAKGLGIKYVSLYAFSTENWKRPKAEVLGLMGLLKYHMRLKLEELNNEKARLRFAGKISEFSDDIRKIIRDAEERTRDNSDMQLIVCLNYGGRQEILDAVDRMLQENISVPVTEEVFRRYLYLPDVPDPDLIIRTSGELRISNFWLWQGSYSEFYFTDKYWPDFDGEDLEKAVADYTGRERRYGKA